MPQPAVRTPWQHTLGAALMIAGLALTIWAGLFLLRRPWITQWIAVAAGMAVIEAGRRLLRWNYPAGGAEAS